MDFKGLKVLVLDGYGRQVPSILQQLHELGCHITTVSCSKLDPGYASKYPDKKILSPYFKNDIEAMQRTIDQELLSYAYDIVIPVLEQATNFITKNVEKFGKHVKIAAAPYEAFINAYDKEKTLKACQEVGVPCPLTRMDDESVEEYVAKAKFPLALKPRKGTGSVGFCKVQTKEELFRLINEGIIKPEEYVIQEFIPQDDIQYCNNIFVGTDGQIKSSVVVQKVRWYPVDAGAGCFTKACIKPDIEKYSMQLLRAINWSGFCAISYIMDPRDNTPKVLEINGRIPAGVKICHLCGINVIQQMIEAAYGEPVTKFQTNIHNGIAIRYFHTDILWLFQSPNRFKSKPSWFNFSNCHDYIFSLKDPLPFFTFGLRGLTRFKTEMKKRNRNFSKKGK